jgi:hypothetical protein
MAEKKKLTDADIDDFEKRAGKLAPHERSMVLDLIFELRLERAKLRATWDHLHTERRKSERIDLALAVLEAKS